METRGPKFIGLSTYLLMALAVCCIAALLSQKAHAQLSTTATIAGTVTDASGAAVPNATVTATNEATNAISTRKTNDQGEFVIPGLPVDSYTVVISKAGFATFKETGIVLHPAITASVNAKLNPATVKTQVVVSGAAPQIQTTSPEISNSVSAQQVRTLPLNGRNYQGLAALMPGVQNLSAGSALGSGGRSTRNYVSVNGGTTDQTFYVLDGIWNENTGNMAQTTIMPNPDSIQEVRVLQNNYSVRYSLMGASVILVQTKSGTNKFHGNAWEYFRNTDLNARNYFSTTVPKYDQNIFGYNIGGPVTIPHAFNTSRKHTFFFFSQQWIRLNQAETLLGITPTSTQRQGIFNQQIIDPSTGHPFPTNSNGQYYIPAAQLNPDSVAYLNALYPLPNYNGTGDNYINNKPQITDQRDDEIKLDHQFSPRLHFTGEYLDERQTFTQNSLHGAGGSIFPNNYESDKTKNQVAQLSLTQILTNNIVNTTSISMNIFDLDLNTEGLIDVSQVLGFSENLPYSGYLSNRIPFVSISGGISPQGIPAARPLHHAADLDDSINDNFSWLLRRNYIEAGLNIVFNTKRQNPPTATNGSWTFSGNFTGNALADFLLGDASTFNQVSDQRRVAIHAMEVSPYVQDQIKLTRRLTFTAGVRVLHMPLPYPAPGSETIFYPSAYDPMQAPTISQKGVILSDSGQYNALNGLVTNGQGVIPKNFSNAHNWYIGPSAGFAWDVFGNGKTAVRGGWGLTYTRIFTNQDCSYGCANNPPALSSVNLVNPVFPNAATSGQAAPKTIQSLTSADKNIEATNVQTYSLGIQQQLPGNWVASIVGAASQSRHLVGSWNYNQPKPYGNYDFNPIINTGSVSPYYYAPYVGYAAITTYVTHGKQNWDALEVGLKHTFGSNLFLSFAYTWSHNLTNNDSVDPYDPNRYYGNASGLNTPQSASISLIWNIPWMRHEEGWKHTVLGGWKYSDMTSLRSGTSMDAGLGIAHQGLAIRPDLTGANISGPKNVNEWFNTAAFSAPQAGYYGTARNGIITGPGLVDFDMALYKNFAFRKNQVLQFRSEAFNTFNHTNFSGVSTSYGASNFGHVTSALDPRILELALRYRF